MRMLAAIPRAEAMRVIDNIFDAQRGDNWREGNERWRSDPYVATAWPELALHIYWLTHHLFGEQSARRDAEALQAIPLKDYRVRPLLTLALTDAYDEKVEAWAIAELSDEAKRAAWEARPPEDKYDEEDPALLPLQVLVRASSDKRDAAMHKVACQSADRRALFVETLGVWGKFVDRDWFARIAMIPTLTEDERFDLGRALARYYARMAAQEHGLYPALLEYEMLQHVIRKERVTPLGDNVTALSCPK